MTIFEDNLSFLGRQSFVGWEMTMTWILVKLCCIGMRLCSVVSNNNACWSLWEVSNHVLPGKKLAAMLTSCRAVFALGTLVLCPIVIGWQWFQNVKWLKKMKMGQCRLWREADYVGYCQTLDGPNKTRVLRLLFLWWPGHDGAKSPFVVLCCRQFYSRLTVDFPCASVGYDSLLCPDGWATMGRNNKNNCPCSPAYAFMSMHLLGPGLILSLKW